MWQGSSTLQITGRGLLMKRIVVQDTTNVPPFNEPARNLRILNKPLWLHHRDIVGVYCKSGLEVESLDDIPDESDEELLVFKDNLFFNKELIDSFIHDARATGHACQIAFDQNDLAITTHALPLQESIRLQDDVYVSDLYYYPAGRRQQPQPLVIDTQAYEMGYYHIPSYMAPNHGDLVFQVPNRVFLSIENWVHVYIANTPMGMFNQARQNDEKMQRARLRNILKWNREEWRIFREKAALVLTVWWERVAGDDWRNHFLSSSKLVKVGKNCSIDPTAIIHGPTTIGDNVYIGPGVVITNSLIGNNVNIMQGSQVMLSVISDRCFLPFNAGVFMSTMMENSMVAQNTTLQVCVVGRNTFIGANNVFTDFHLLGQPIKTYHRGKLVDVGMPVLGSAVGHNCKIGSGFVVYPGRMVGSNTVLILDQPEINLIKKSINVPDVAPAMCIPGLPYDDSEAHEDVRYTVYQWPRIVDPDTGVLHDPQELGEQEEHRQRQNNPPDHTPGNDNRNHTPGHQPEQTRESREHQHMTADNTVHMPSRTRRTSAAHSRRIDL
jgi:acetyltransferase-like isoleucine patch superfamily enzyme